MTKTGFSFFCVIFVFLVFCMCLGIFGFIVVLCYITSAIDCLERPSLKWPIMCRQGRKAPSHSLPWGSSCYIIPSSLHFNRRFVGELGFPLDILVPFVPGTEPLEISSTDFFLCLMPFLLSNQSVSKHWRKLKCTDANQWPGLIPSSSTTGLLTEWAVFMLDFPRQSFCSCTLACGCQ